MLASVSPRLPIEYVMSGATKRGTLDGGCDCESCATSADPARKAATVPESQVASAAPDAVFISRRVIKRCPLSKALTVPRW
jgi:hypothetical protein